MGIAVRPKRERQLTTQLSRGPIPPGRSVEGHEGRFAPPSLSAGYEIRKETSPGRTGMSDTRRKRAFCSEIQVDGGALAI
jgi:hypothetical protein